VETTFMVAGSRTGLTTVLSELSLGARGIMPVIGR
jgi:hypothetical protein